MTLKKEKRQDEDRKVVEYLVNDPLNPDDDTPVTTYVLSGTAPTPTPTPEPQPEPEEVVKTPEDDPSSTTRAEDGSPLSDGQSVLSVINYWREQYGVGELAWGTDLEAAAANTGAESGGDSASMEHHPMDLQTVEVIAPGNDNANGKDLGGRSPFEVSLANWLCQVQGDPLGDLCEWSAGVMPR